MATELTREQDQAAEALASEFASVQSIGVEPVLRDLHVYCERDLATGEDAYKIISEDGVVTDAPNWNRV